MPLFILVLPFLSILISLPRSDAEIPSGNTSEDWICSTTQDIPLQQVTQRENYGRCCTDKKEVCLQKAGSDAGAILWKVIAYHRSFINWVFLESQWPCGKNGPFHRSFRLMSAADRAMQVKVEWKSRGGRNVTQHMRPGICKLVHVFYLTNIKWVQADWQRNSNQGGDVNNVRWQR